MVKFRTMSETILFLSGGDPVLARDGTVLRFSAGPMQTLLKCILEAASSMPCDEETAALSLADRFADADVRAVWQVLVRHGILAPEQDVANEKAPPGVEHPELTFIVQEASERDASSRLHSSSLGESGEVTTHAKWEAANRGDPDSTGTSVFVFPYYDRVLFEKLNRAFLSRRKPWMLSFRNARSQIFFSFLPGASACLECHWPFTISDLPQDDVLFHAPSGPGPYDDLSWAFTFSNASRARNPEQSDLDSFVLRLDLESGAVSRVRRLKQPRCAQCGTGARP